MKHVDSKDDESVDLLSFEELEKMEAENPELRAISTYLIKYSDSDGNLGELVDDEEFDSMVRADDRLRELCEILLDSPSPEEKENHEVGRRRPVKKNRNSKKRKASKRSLEETRSHVDKLSKKQRLSIELDRAMVWRGIYEYNKV